MKNINGLYEYLLENGVVQEDLPSLMPVTKLEAVDIIHGCKNKPADTEFYFCVCNSGHIVHCNELEILHSGWNLRVIGDNVWFLSEDEVHKFDLANIPQCKNVYFIVSKRTKVHELARDRTDMLYVSSNRKRLKDKIRNNEQVRRVKNK